MIKILIINQYFPPDRAATALLLGQLVDGLSESAEVHVISGTPTYNPDTSRPGESKKWTESRVPLIPISRSFLPVRILNYFLYLLGAIFMAMTSKKYDVVMCWTDPPLVGLVGCLTKWVKGSRFLFVSQDVYPEVALYVGKMNSWVSLALLGWTSRIILQTADTIVAVGRDMREKLIGKGVPVDRLVVIPNWQDLTLLKPVDGIRFRSKYEISPDSFLVMHSGNVGLSQDFDTLLETAKLTRENKNIEFAIVGDGSRKKEIEQKIRDLRLQNVRMLPYQPEETLSHSLSAADVHYVSLKPQLTGYIVPSKVYGVMAVARPFIANVSSNSEVEQITKESGCGVSVSPEPEKIAKILIDSSHSRSKWKEMGENGRRWIESNNGTPQALRAYRQIFQMLGNE